MTRIGVGLAGLSAAMLLGLTACGTGSAADASRNLAPAAPVPSSTTSAPEPTASGSPTAVPGDGTTSAAGTPTPVPARASAERSSAAPVRALLRRGDRGEKVRELQHRLRQLDWYAGSISGQYAASTVEAVTGYQRKRQLPATGIVDAATWSSLVGRTRTPTAAERHDRLVAGPALLRQGSSGASVRRLQARLRQIGWFAGNVTDHYGAATVDAVRGFQAKRGIPVTGEVDQRTLDRLTGMTHVPTAAELANQQPAPAVGGRLDPRCLTGRALCISKSSRSLAWVVNGKALYRTDVRFGSELTPTRDGAFAVGWKSRHHVSTIYHTAMPFSMFFSGGQAVHYSADFAARGYNGASHGCVNVRDYNGIAWLFDQVRVGDKVIVYW